MDALLFDMDDTLYDHLEPFALAYEDMFAGTYAISVEHLFFISRKYSDKAFERLQCGGITMDELCIYRIQKAFQELHIEIPAGQAREFQRRYAGYQMEVRISDKMKEILAFCKEKVPMGIITNGTTDHQRPKIEQLGIRQWIPDQNIFISEEMGMDKPDKRIFCKACERMGIARENVWFVGDSYVNDIEGAQNAGLHTIWIRRRSHNQQTGSVSPDHCVKTEEELYMLLQKLLAAGD